MKDSRGKIIYMYDSRNRLSSVRYEKGVLMNYRYDPVGNLVSCVVSSQSDAVVADSSSPPSSQPVHTIDKKLICPSCNTPITPGNRFCRNCGADVTQIALITPKQAAVCQSCHHPVSPGKKFCSNCGTAIQPVQSKPSKCPGCGKPLKPNIMFCGSCGFKVQS